MSVKRKDDDVVDDISPFADLRKNLVIRDARIFNDRDLNPSKCAQVLTKLFYLLSQGETFTSEESTEIFFGVTKLFQSSDATLRRLVYLMIKELSVGSDSSLIVVASLSKDMTSNIDLFRGNAIRVLSKIVDSSMIQQMERFFKAAIVDKNPFITTAALCVGQKVFNTSPDIVKRWSNEVQEAMGRTNKMVPFHSLALTYRIKQNDKLAVNKIVTSLSRSQQHASSPLAQALHIRIMASLLNTTYPFNADLFKLLTDYLHNKPFMVMFEAAKAITRLDGVQQVQVVPAVSVLQEMLSSGVPTQRFAAVRVMSEVVVRFPAIVVPCIVDLEHLISDSNRSIATYAITTLLKTGVESNVDRLLKSLQGFMADTSDDFKIVIVDAIRSLCIKFPHKYPQLLSFLSQALREEGGFRFKKSIVDAMLSIIQDVKEATDPALDYLCEFIEDSEFPELSVRILHLLGDKGPSTPNPAKFIRYIFNRVILEMACVRVAAVSSLAKFASAVPSLKDNCTVLLNRCLNDHDDEVRDRAVFYLNLLQNENVTSALMSPRPFPNLHQLEVSLNRYLEKVTSDPSIGSFSIDKHLVQLTEEQVAIAEGDVASLQAVKKQKEAEIQREQKAKAASDRAAGVTFNPHIEVLHSIPDIKALGIPFKSSSPVQLTQPETEYVVSCVKHVYRSHLVFHFLITNNLDDHCLESVSVSMELDQDGWSEDFSVPESQIKHGSQGSAFVVFSRPSNSFQCGPIQCTLKFTSKEVEDGEVSGDGHEDEYQLEDLEVHEADFMRPGESIGLVEFKRQWETLGEGVEIVKKYSLGLDSLPSAVTAVIDLLGMHPCENGQSVPDGATKHACNLVGAFFIADSPSGLPVMARAGFMLDPKHGVTLKLAIRSNNPSINNMLTGAIR